MELAANSKDTGYSVIDRNRIVGLISRIRHEIIEDRALGRAAELAFFLILSLFPLLICVLSLLTFIPPSRELIMNYLAELMPDQAMQLVRNWVNELFDQRSRAIFSFGLIFTLWSASSGVAALIDVLNVAYEVPEERSFFRTRWVALMLTIGLAVLILAGCALVIYGGNLGRWIFSDLDIGTLYYRVARAASYAGGFFLLFAALQLTYNFAPNVDRKVNRTWPGSLFGTSAILLCSYLFSIYLRYGPSYSATYGSIGAVVVLMIWLYLVGLIIMIGAEINSELLKRKERRVGAAA